MRDAPTGSPAFTRRCPGGGEDEGRGRRHDYWSWTPIWGIRGKDPESGKILQNRSEGYLGHLRHAENDPKIGEITSFVASHGYGIDLGHARDHPKCCKIFAEQVNVWDWDEGNQVINWSSR